MRSLTLILSILPFSVFAAGSGTPAPPVASPTTTDCTDGKVWDADSGTCVVPSDARLDDAERLGAVRELAYAGRPADAGAVLDQIADQADDMVMTYRGFLARQAGNRDAAFIAYVQALARNPDNLLARSYMGQAHVEDGDLEGARRQLAEIRDRGGAGSWPELSLRMAIRTGTGFSY